MENNKKFELNDEQLEQASGGMTNEEFKEFVKNRLYYRCVNCKGEYLVYGDRKLPDKCTCGYATWECLGNRG